jgi:hypothetical protein
MAEGQTERSEMNRTTLAAYLFAAVILVGIGYAWGYVPQHIKLVELQTRVDQAATDQKRLTDKINTLNTEATENAKTEYEKGKQANADWYERHRTEWLQDDGCRAVPRSPDNPETTSGIPATGNVAPTFSPEQCSDVALRLETMLDLLHHSPLVRFE